MENAILEHQARFLAGDLLSNVEQESLVSWLEQNPDERDEFLLNESVDSQLRLLPRLDQSEAVEGFVSATISRAKANIDSKDDFVEPVRIEPVSRMSSTSRSQITIALCTAAAVLIGLSLSLHTWDRGDRQNKPATADLTHAELLNPEEISWELENRDANRLRIMAGNARLKFNSGATVVAEAPAVVELKSGREFFLSSGQTSLVVPSSAIGFTVVTPRARIIDLGTEFSVDVDGSRATDTTVSKGSVTFEARLQSGDYAEPVKLTPTGLNQASAELSRDGNNVPSIRTIATGTNGEFVATVHSAGNTTEFRSRSAYEDFLSPTTEEPRSAPEPQQEDGNNPPESTADSNNPPATSDPAKNRRTEADRRAARLKQLRWMQQQQPNNPAIQAMIDDLEAEQVDLGNMEEKP